MASAAQRIGYKEEQYVARMNLRFEKLLKQQISRLEREKAMRARGFQADRKPYEDKLDSFKTRAKQVRENNADQFRGVRRPGLVREKTVDRKLNELRNSNRIVTGAGYSYIEQLFGNFSKPLISRPIRWGINPATTDLRRPPAHVPTLPRIPSNVPAVRSVERPKFARGRRKPNLNRPHDPEQPELETSVEGQVVSEVEELSVAQWEGFDPPADKTEELKQERRARLLPIPEDDEPNDTGPARPTGRLSLQASDTAAPVPSASGGQVKDPARDSAREEPGVSENNSTGCFITIPLVELPAHDISYVTQSLDLAQPISSTTNGTNSSAKSSAFKYLLHGRRSSF